MVTKELRLALIEKAKELRGQNALKDQIAIEQTAELIDEIQRTTERELALEVLSRNWRTNTFIAEALDRIENGTYGTCLMCEKAIPERRLKALPWARNCVPCQALVDQEGIVDDIQVAA